MKAQKVKKGNEEVKKSSTHGISGKVGEVEESLRGYTSKPLSAGELRTKSMSATKACLGH